MTRKRFVKLLMARGFSRNEAVNFVQVHLPACGSYESLYIKWMIGFCGNYDFAEALNRLLEAATKIVKETIAGLNVTDCPYTSGGLMELINETRDEN